MSGPTQLALDLPARPAMGREDFLVAPCNQDSVAWVDKWPDWAGPCLVLFGSEGSGKTHLAHVWQNRAKALLDDNIDDRRWLDHLGGGGALCLDINGCVENEEGLLHLFNTARENAGSILLTGVAPVSGWSLALPDLRSRLRAAPNVGLAPPDDALLGAVLVKLFADRQLDVGPPVLKYLLPRMERSFAAAGELVQKLDNASLAARQRITVPFVRRVIGDGPAGHRA